MRPMSGAQRWDPERYARNAPFVADPGAPLIDLLAPRRGDRILDLGCGDGALTERIAARGCRVVGVDAGPEQRPDLVAEVRETLRPALHGTGDWTADYARLCFAATLGT